MKPHRVPLRGPAGVLCLCALVAGIAACASSGDGPHTRLSARRPAPDEWKELGRLRKLFVASHEGYQAERDKLLGAKTDLVQWFVYSLVLDAIKAYDNMKAQNVEPSEFMATETGKRSFFGRTQREIHYFDKVGRATVMLHFMRDRRAEIREVGKLLLGVQPLAELMPAIKAEFAGDSLHAKKALLELLGTYKGEKAAMRFVQDTVSNADWRIRALAIGILAELWRGTPGVEGAAYFWRMLPDEKDSFVRRKILEAVGLLGDQKQARPLVDKLGELLQEGKGKEAEACAIALRKLTGQRFGTSYGAWRDWLGR